LGFSRGLNGFKLKKKFETSFSQPPFTLRQLYIGNSGKKKFETSFSQPPFTLRQLYIGNSGYKNERYLQ